MIRRKKIGRWHESQLETCWCVLCRIFSSFLRSSFSPWFAYVTNPSYRRTIIFIAQGKSSQPRLETITLTIRSMRNKIKRTKDSLDPDSETSEVNFR